MKVLALGGGGSGGLAAAMYLAHLETRLGRPLYEEFDLIAGVSTGAIIATALAGGMSAKTMVELYKRELPVIFKRPWWRFWGGYIGCSRYGKAALKSALQRMLPLQTLGDARTDLMIYSNQVAPELKTKFWKSWRNDDSLLSAASCVAASCSAPMYFDPEEYLGGVYIDGGLSTNDPGAPAVAEMLRRTKDPVVCLDIQVCRASGMDIRTAAEKVSAVDWISGIFSDTLTFGQDASGYIAETMLGSERYLKISLDIEDPMDASGDAFNARCKKRADDRWLLSEDSVEDLLGRG